MSSKQDKQEDAELSLTGMGTQLGINVAIAVGVLLVFSILRPNNSRMYNTLIEQSRDLIFI